MKIKGIEVIGNAYYPDDGTCEIHTTGKGKFALISARKYKQFKDDYMHKIDFLSNELTKKATWDTGNNFTLTLNRDEVYAGDVAKRLEKILEKCEIKDEDYQMILMHHTYSFRSDNEPTIDYDMKFKTPGALAMFLFYWHSVNP